MVLENSSKPSPAPLIMQLIGTFLLDWVIGLTATTNALLTAILIVLMVVFLIIANGLFAQKSSVTISIEAGFIMAHGRGDGYLPGCFVTLNRSL